MNIIETPLPGVLIIEPKTFGDDRGYFMETYSLTRYASNGMKLPFVQDNESFSRQGILRGLHYQLQQPQGKLVRVSQGEVYDVALDIRVGSPTFGQWYGVLLSSENKRQFYVPPGYAHGFCVTSPTAAFQYKCTDYYSPQDEYGIVWNDPDLAIQWPEQQPLLSKKDAVLPCLKDVPPEKLPQFRG
ncbi:MAG: dTDP-4-dehydrorhamnose 3,5-epimerase [Cyanobacteria bacterium P01_F01_bin.42]